MCGLANSVNFLSHVFLFLIALLFVVRFACVAVEKVTALKLLGVTLDNTMNFGQRLRSVTIVENARKSRLWQWASGHNRSRSEECM